MNWKLINKDPKNQPTHGDYTAWKEQIAEECYHQCVYCSIHENPWGGIDHYHIDHYRPKSRKEFEHLKNDICNLFYACPICNRFKKDDWPGEPNDLDKICYPDPSKIDYATLFYLDLTDHSIRGNYKSANYVIERLYLNRPQLLFERRENKLKEKEANLFNEVTDLIDQISDIDLIHETVGVLNDIRQHLFKRDSIRPYKLSEIKKS